MSSLSSLPTKQLSPQPPGKDLWKDGPLDSERPEPKRQNSSSQNTSLWVTALPIMSYCLASILMTVVNKFVVSGKNFSMNFLILAIQSFVSVSCVFISKRIGLITYRDFDMGDAKRWFPVSFLLVTVIYTGSKSLQFLSINVYTIFKNLTIILIAYGEVMWFGGRVTGLTFLSFLLMVFSSVIAAWADISTSFSRAWSSGDPAAAAAGIMPLGLPIRYVGYFWMLSNCIAQAGYVLLMRKKIKSTNFKDWDSMFYNNLLSVPVLVLFSFTIEDWSSRNLEINFPAEARNFLLFAIAFSGAAAVFISYSTAWCIRVTSSTTYSMVGSLNKLPVAASGMIFFGEAVTTGSVSAILTGFFAGLLYAFAKNNQKKQEAVIQPDNLPMYRRA